MGGGQHKGAGPAGVSAPRGSGEDGCEWRRPAQLFLFFFSALLSFEGYPVTPTAGPRWQTQDRRPKGSTLEKGGTWPRGLGRVCSRPRRTRPSEDECSSLCLTPSPITDRWPSSGVTRRSIS